MIAFTPEQDRFIVDHRYAEVEANRSLFPVPPSYADYIRRRQQLRLLGFDVPDLRGRPRAPSAPAVHLPMIPEDASDQEVWEAMVELQQHLRTKHPVEVQIRIETDHPIGVAFMSDWHIGGIGTDHQALIRDIDLINACPSLFAYVGGDPTENFVTPKLAHAAREHLVPPETQWRLYRWLIERLRPRLLAIGKGNHDLWTEKLVGIDGIEAALQGIQVLHTGEDTYLELIVGDQTYVIYRKHRPIATSRLHKSAGAKKSYDLGDRTFDVGVTEHHHEASLCAEMRHGRYRWFITTGSYKIDDSFAREGGYVHGSSNVPVMIFYPRRHKMIGYLSLEDAIEWLEYR